MNTQQLIDQALNSERKYSSIESKSDWSQFADHAGVDVEIWSNSVVDDKAREQGFVSEYKVVTTRFFIGIKRISRAQAEAVLAEVS